jgi:hypothetical protein
MSMTPNSNRIENPYFERCIPFPKYSEAGDLIGGSCRTRFWFRYVGWTSFSGVFALLLLFVIALRDRERRSYWPPVLLGGIAGIQVCWMLYAFYWFHHRHREVEKSEETFKLELIISPIGLILFAGEYPAIFPWDRISYLWQFPDCWMVIPKRNHFDRYIPIPTSWLDEETKQFIVDQVKRHGGTVKVNPGLGVGLCYLQKVF